VFDFSKEVNLLGMDKLQLTELNLGQVFSSRSGCMHDLLVLRFETKTDLLKVETFTF
jgi:hypothetical protein